MATIVVVGGSLPGMAAAARLARVGHAVTIVEQRPHLGGRLASPGVWAPVLGFPAPLKDLFRKSGRTLDAELGRRGLRLVPAPPVEHTFADGVRLLWPTDRAEQWHLLHDRYSPGVATHWRDTLDDLDETWQLLRPLGLEGELVDRAQIRSRRPRLDHRRSLEQLARHVNQPHLSELVRDVAFRVGSTPSATPCWLATRLSVDRTFGRWLVVDADDNVQRPGVLLEVLAERLATRGVRVLTSTDAQAISREGVRTADGTIDADAVISTVDPWTHARLLTPRDTSARLGAARLKPALAPHVSVRHVPQRQPFAEQTRHTASGPIITYRRPTATGTEIVVHDHTSPRLDPGLGVRWHGPRTWLLLPAVRAPRNERLFVASASGRGGNEPWAQLLAGALATYAVHERLTGEDIRPSNRDYKP